MTRIIRTLCKFMTTQEVNTKFDKFLADYNNKYIKVLPNNFSPHLFDVWYHKRMKKFLIKSRTHGDFEVLLDDKDYDLVVSMGKWNIHIVRGDAYVQKRITHTDLISLHRFLLGAKKGEYVDHIDHNPLNNQRSNLRIVSNGANLRNGRIRVNNTSGYRGVSFRDNRWRARIKVNYKDINLGHYKEKEDAIKARQKAERKYWNV